MLWRVTCVWGTIYHHLPYLGALGIGSLQTTTLLCRGSKSSSKKIYATDQAIMDNEQQFFVISHHQIWFLNNTRTIYSQTFAMSPMCRKISFSMARTVKKAIGLSGATYAAKRQETRKRTWRRILSCQNHCCQFKTVRENSSLWQPEHLPPWASQQEKYQLLLEKRGGAQHIRKR